ncbi:MAG: cysteine-rich CWC family protein [Paludibacteraceae bacterium]|nr:cysteine-rich CWC family protein [Paludibacteraceae bacterium]MBR0065461.1 cysteine-rich CWC family protein [Paludibacteraceae bacterium]
MVNDQIVNVKVCPRCGAAFECTHDVHCQCVGIHLSENARAYLRTHFSDCLCRNCLEQVAMLYNTSTPL